MTEIIDNKVRLVSYTYHLDNKALAKKVYTYDGFNHSEKVKTFDGNVQINHYDAEGYVMRLKKMGNLYNLSLIPTEKL